MNKDHQYAFYGSLRKGMYNYEAAKGSMEYIGTETISGFKLFSLGAYPCVIRSDNEEDTLVVDLFTVTGPRERSIHNMEIGAGYNYEEVEINGQMFGIYTFDKENGKRLENRLVPGGDWVKYLQPQSERTTV